MPEMLPHPMMPTLSESMWSVLDGLEKIEAGAGGLRRIGGLVVLHHHPLGPGLLADAPKVAPVEHPRAHVGPAVLVLVLPGGRNVLHVGGGDPAAVAVDPLLGIHIAAGEPSHVDLPCEGASLSGLEDQLEGCLAAVLGLQLPMVVV